MFRRCSVFCRPRPTQSGRFIYVNAAFERIFGYTAEEIAGRNMIDLVLPEDRARTLRAASDIMAGEPKFSFENRYLRKDGQVVHIMWSARWSENEKVRVAVARDITRRKRAEAMQAAMYAMSEAVHVATDPFGLFALAHRIVGNLLPADQVVVAVRGEHDAALHVAYAADRRAEHPLPGVLPRGGGGGRAAAQRRRGR